MIKVVVITRDNAKRLMRTARSLASAGVRGNQLLLVDDSPSATSAERNRSVLERVFGDTPRTFSRCRQAEIMEYLPQASRRPLRPHFELGKACWNAYAARNVGLLLSAATWAQHRCLWLDDDVEVSRNVIERASRTPRACISAFPMRGLPDFSRSKWISIFLSCTDLASVPHNAAELAGLLRTYTDLDPGIHDSAGPQDFAFPLPWNAAHGAAYATNIDLARAPLFPVFRGEDYFWHRRLIDLGATRICRRVAVRHCGQRREMLNGPVFLGEELGALQATCLRLVLSNPNLNVRRTLATLVTRRRRQLNDVAEKALQSMGTAANPAAAGEIFTMLEALICKFSSCEVLDQGVAEVAASFEANALWRSISPAIDSQAG